MLLAMSKIQLLIGVVKYGFKMYKWLRAEQKNS